MRESDSMPSAPNAAASTGVAGLDIILRGGLPRGEMHLVQGASGTGKTTMALHFLRAGVSVGESCLCLTLAQSPEQLDRIAQSHGWTLDGVVVHELSPGSVAGSVAERIASRQSILPSAEMELAELFLELSERVERLRPQRAVIDSISILRLLAGSPQRYHQEVVMLRQLFVERGCTLLVLADQSMDLCGEQQSPASSFHPLSGCALELTQEPRTYGDVRRRFRIIKARGFAHDGGYHDFKIRTGHLEVYPRLGAYTLPEHSDYTFLPSGVPMLDELLGGGLNSGTSCLIVGPSGTGKSTVATLYVEKLADAGNRAAVFLFDERPETYLVRGEQFGVHLRRHVEAGRVIMRQMDPGEIAPGEFAQGVARLVNEQQVKIVVLDSIVGYFAAMGYADVLVSQLHELITFLTRRGVLVIMCGAQEGFTSIGDTRSVDVSYLSDTVIALTYFETEGRLRRAVAIAKKKQGLHVGSIHEFLLTPGQVDVSRPPLSELRNVMVSKPTALERTTLPR